MISFIQCRELANNNLAILPSDVFRNSVALKYVTCTACLDCDCLSASTYQWITNIVIDKKGYEFTCRNGVVLPNTVVNCSDDGSRLAVTSIENDSSCNCKDSITIQLSSMDSDITDNEINKTINDGIDFIPTVHGEMAKKYNNIPPKSHMNIIDNAIDVIKSINFNGQMNKEYNNIPPKSHMNIIDNAIDVIKSINFNGQMNKEYDSIPPKSHITLSSFSNIPYFHHIMTDIADNDINKTSNDGIDFIPTVYGEMAKKYNNIPPKSHMNIIDNGIDVIKSINFNGQMNKEYNNIPPKSHMNTIDNGIDVLKTINYNEQMNKEYDSIPP
ncbi:unnamed protein product [Mytilus coruscus]|uniref:Uncharacterized protein n=1 Tax=Mytilus coruscus TaxID=42192 RepID=A0A6J8A360_MYTCO|nr:unnamed protein product [Mytilus coruscus]